ncbi:tyrosine-protein phosphatase non-receptor type 23-like [Macrosteles quadrilineatus]|uniref:tyrosine-protein phosphatase non-receptor type 23-like n=1 Tax=Macrosteles quadrilineatus TaxID=74068 RepID=UPI0023E23E76|nr:tyrosine-protein phosphatase non-receptor type 23-like [Macrosteles quadrilineatus]
MEAVPRLPMISFLLKVSPDRQPTDFGKLKQYIRDFYHDDPETYSAEFHKLEALRATAMRPANDATGCAVLKKYYCQLHFLQSRFPMGKDGAASVNFTWRDTYASMVCTLADIRYEMVSVLYNIGALHSQLGATDPRATNEGLKLACTHFQCAAYAFQHLKDTYPQPAGLDLAPDLMQFMYQISLAQAQECILEKSMTDNRKATINAKVAAQIVDYYNMAMNALTRGGSDGNSVLETVGNSQFKSWKRYVKFKSTFYGCIALLYQGQQSEEQQKMGERVAYYQAALDKLAEATKLTKGLDHPEVIEDAITFTMDVVEGKRKAAKNENEFIYHEEVPEKDALPEIKKASLVKGIPFEVTDPEISGPDIFGRLVPMKAHEASSLYSEEKAKLLRRMGAMIDEKDEQLVAFTSSLQLECVNAHLESNRLPQDIVDRCAALSAKPDAIQNLIEAMDKLSDIYHDVEAMLKEIMELIQNEEVEEKEYQQVMGSRPPSIVATDLTREAKKYEEAHNKAAMSNQTLHKAMTQHIANLRLLELPLSELAQQIPSVSALNLGEQPVVKEMQMLVGKVEEMRRQRAMLSSQLRESVCADDITTQLVTRQHDNLEAIFQEELQKHVKYVSLIEQNLTAQDNIIKALTETYAQYAPVRKATMEVMRQRNLTLSALISSYDAYEDLIAKTNKGQEFYKKLETNVTKLHQRVKGTCKVQQEERDTILAKNCKTLPSKVKSSVDDVHPYIPPGKGPSGGPKLKDYLENYKRDKSGGISQIPGGQMNEPYYNQSIPAKPTGYPDNVTAYDPTPLWVPSVRPAPVGQEGTTPSTTSQDLKQELSMSLYSSKSLYSPRINTEIIHPPYENMFKKLEYDHSKYDYDVLREYDISDDDPSTPNPKLPNTGYPAPAPSSIGQSVTTYPVTPASLAQNYLTSYDIYKQPAENASQYSHSTWYSLPTSTPQSNVNSQQGYTPTNVPTTLSQEYSTQTYQPNQPQNTGHVQQMTQYPSGFQNYPTHNYPTATTVNLQHYPTTIATPQATSYQAGFNQSSLYPYQTPSTQPQTSVMQSQQPIASASPASGGYNLQNNQVANPYTTQNSAVAQGTQGGQAMYTQYSNAAYPAAYSTLTNQGSHALAQSSDPSNQQYSPYIPQMYSAYTNDKVSQANTTPWANSQPGQIPQNYYNQYANFSQSTEAKYTPATAASYYSRAGQSSNYQTSASTPQQTNQVGQPTYTQGNYYYQPYGYQYTSGTLQNLTVESPSRVYTPSQTQQGQITPQSPMTYMQASSNLTLTSVNSAKSVTGDKDSSNVDLLAGLDFSVSQDPLVPQQQKEVSVKPVSVNSIVEKFAAVTLTETSSSETTVESNSSVESKASVESSESVYVTAQSSSEDKVGKKFQLKDPFNDTEALNQFVQEVEKFEKFVESLTVKTLNGPTPLDIKWKELLDLKEKDSDNHSISVARCYPVKNRFSDILPYDNSRVELPSTKDDYINASYVKDVTPNFPDFIVTQMPLQATFGDFWTMVLEQQVELIVCLLNDTEVEEAGGRYWPTEKGVEMIVGRVKLTLQTCNTCKHWVERIIYVTDTRLAKVVVHLQFTEWPGSSFPSSPGPFLSLVSESLNNVAQQRGGGPAVVHCLSGVGRSGLFLLTAASICHILNCRTLPDLVILAAVIARWRKNPLRDREHFRFSYQTLLYYAQDLLMKRGILASRSSFEEKRTKSHTRHPSEDFLLGPPKDVMPQESPEKKQSEGISSEAAASNSSDPLSQLDPLWSLKRPK